MVVPRIRHDILGLGNPQKNRVIYLVNFGKILGRISGADEAHKKKTHKISENPLGDRVSLKHPAGVPAKMPFSVRFSIAKNRTSLKHWPVDRGFS